MFRRRPALCIGKHFPQAAWLVRRWALTALCRCAGKPHIIKEENYLLFGVVEEKALKTASKKITFDFWSVRQNVLQDRRFNAALVLQTLWRAVRERRRRKCSARARVAAHTLRSSLRPNKLAGALRVVPPLPSPGAASPHGVGGSTPSSEPSLVPSPAAVPVSLSGTGDGITVVETAAVPLSNGAGEEGDVGGAGHVAEMSAGGSLLLTGGPGRTAAGAAGVAEPTPDLDSPRYLDLSPRGLLPQGDHHCKDRGTGLLLAPLEGSGGDAAV